MTNTNVRSALARCFEEFIAVLAGHGHTTVKEIQEMFSVYILCREMATVAIGWPTSCVAGSGWATPCSSCTPDSLFAGQLA